LSFVNYSDHEKEALLSVARNSIDERIRLNREPTLELERYPDSLKLPGASFITLKIGSELRGCTGTLFAVQPLLVDVSGNACRSAMSDPRFMPVGIAEIGNITISVSVLSALETVQWKTFDEACRSLRPGLDGLYIRERNRSATFLPSVWDSLCEPRHFLNQLFRKAGLPEWHWSDTMTVQRYTAAYITES